jgi:hypothetical protein
MAMMAMTVRSSMSVKPGESERGRGDFFIKGFSFNKTIGGPMQDNRIRPPQSAANVTMRLRAHDFLVIENLNCLQAT